MNETPQVHQARVRADEAQHRIVDLLHELQERIAPKTLARDAWEGAKSKGADLAEDAVDAVRRRPLAATGAAAAVAMFLAREPLMDFASRLWNGKGDEHGTRAKSKRKSNRQPQAGTHETVEDVNDR